MRTIEIGDGFLGPFFFHDDKPESLRTPRVPIGNDTDRFDSTALTERIGDIKTFDGFLVAVPHGVDVSTYTTVVVWCEAFSQFISAAKYR